MPLRDHFHPPLSERRMWDGLHGGWPAMMVTDLLVKLPSRYRAAPFVHLSTSFVVDEGNYAVNETATQPTLDFEIESFDSDQYEVRVYDDERDHQLVAAIEIVSPSNKDRPESRQAFASKCVALMSQDVSVMIVDLVTSCSTNLFGDVLQALGRRVPKGMPPLMSVACRPQTDTRPPRLQAWVKPMVVGEPLPTLPLWLSEDLAIRLDLEPSYEETCRILRM